MWWSMQWQGAAKPALLHKGCCHKHSFFSQRAMIGFPLCLFQVEKCYLSGQPNWKEKIILTNYVNNFYKTNYFWTLWICIQVTCLTVWSSEGRGTNTGEVGHLIDALSSIQTGLWLTFIYVWGKHAKKKIRKSEKRRLSADDSVSRWDFAVFTWNCKILSVSKTLSWIKSPEFPFWKHRVSLTRCLVLRVIRSHVETRIHELCRVW